MSILEVDPQNIRKTAQALSGDLRMQILELLRSEEKNLNDISKALKTPLSTTTVNVQKLEEAGLINIKLEPGKRGIQKLCSLAYDQVIFNLNSIEKKAPYEDISMPVGHYTQAQVTAPCGICSSEKRLGKINDIRTFFTPGRIDGQLIWFSTGYLEYQFPNIQQPSQPLSSLEISCELCSEVPFYKNRVESDISLWLNGIDIGKWISPGDFGGKKGKLTPQWWGKHNTQFGILVTWKIGKEGSYCNGKKVSDITLSDLKLSGSPFIVLRLGVKEDAEHARGMNLFGQKFGNHPQDLILRFNY